MGRALERFEDEALLRGAGPVPRRPRPGARRAPRRDPSLAARPRADRPPRRDARARASPASTGVLTGADVAEGSRPFPAACPTEVPVLRGRRRGDALRRRAARGRRRARPLRRRGRPRADRRRVRAARGAHGPARRGRRDRPVAVSDRSFSYGDPDAAFAARRPRRPRAVRLPALDVRARSSATASSPTGTTATAALTAWANFQGPFTLHSVAAAALGLPGSKLRLITPPDSRRQLRDQGDRLRLRRPDRARLAQARRARPLDRGPPRAPRGERARSTAAHRPTSRPRSRPTASCSGSATTSLEDVGAYVRAPEPATLYRMHGSLTGAYRVRDVAVRNRVVLTNRCPTALNRGFGGPQLYLRARAARWRSPRAGSASTRPSLAPPQPDRRGRVPLHDAVRRALRLGRLRGLPRRRARARPLRRAARRAARGPRGRAASSGSGSPCVVEPSISNMGYVTLAQTGRGARAGAAEVGQRRGRDASRISPLGGITVRIVDDAAGPGARDGRRADRRRRARRRRREDDRGGDRHGHLDERLDGRLAATTRRGSRASARARSTCAAEKLAAKLAAIAAAQLDASPRTSCSLRRGVAPASVGLAATARGAAHWNPRPAGRDGAGPARDRVLRRAATSTPPDDEDRVASSAAHGFIVDVAVVEVDRGDRAR